MVKKNARSRPRVLLIGLDSADADLIAAWSAQGYMPTFAALRRQGLWGRLSTTAEIMHVSAWPTIYTGTTPGQHGMYHAFQIRAGEQNIRRTEPNWCGRPPFWKYLDDAGRKCIVMDAFMDYPLPGFRGIQVLEYGTWTWFGKPSSTPQNTLREIKRRFGPYPAPEHSKVVRIPDDPITFRDQLIRGTQIKSSIAQAILHENDWAMAFVTFGEPHGAGHYLWHVSDPDYPLHPVGGVPDGMHAMREIYGAVDQAVAGILKAVDDRTTVIITSGDGMGPNYSGCHLMPELLHRMGLFYSSTVGNGGGRSGASVPRKGLLSMIRQAMPMSIRQSITRCLPREMRYRLNLKWVNSGIDWAHSKVFCIPNSNEAYFRINLIGREPQGIVTPGTEYDETLASVRAELEQLTNPQNGMRAVKHIVLMDTIYQGPRRPDLPDGAANWNLDARILGELETPRLGRIRGRPSYDVSPFYTGNHRPNAFVLARGPSLPENKIMDNGHILDIAPTILTVLDVEPPSHFEGNIWGLFLT